MSQSIVVYHAFSYSQCKTTFIIFVDDFCLFFIITVELKNILNHPPPDSFISINVLGKNECPLYHLLYCCLSVSTPLFCILLCDARIWALQATFPLYQQLCVILCHQGVLERGCKVRKGPGISSFLSASCSFRQASVSVSISLATFLYTGSSNSFLLQQLYPFCRFYNLHTTSLNMSPQRLRCQLPVPPPEKSEFQLCETFSSNFKVLINPTFPFCFVNPNGHNCFQNFQLCYSVKFLFFQSPS